LLYNFALEFAIRKVQGNHGRSEFNVIHQFLECADDINIVGSNLNTIKKVTEAVLEGTREVGLEANTEKNKRVCFVTKM
jgi:hypothetical protein